MTACLPAASSPKSFPALKAEPFAELARSIGGARSERQWIRGGLEIVFVPSPSLHDGRFANDGWLQELPDPLTKLTWDNPALVSPKTAETLGLANEDVVRVDYSGRSLELPVWLAPRHGGRRGRLDARLRPFARGSHRLGRRVRRVQGPKLQSTRLRQRGHPHQARRALTRSRRPRSTAAWRGAPSCASRRWPSFRSKPAAGAEPAESAHAGKPHKPRKRAEPRSASSKRNRLTSPSGRSIPTIRATSGG